MIVSFESIDSIHLLKISLDLGDSISLSFAVSFAFCSSLSSILVNVVKARISVSSVYILTTLNVSFLVETSRQGLYIEVTINSFFL